MAKKGADKPDQGTSHFDLGGVGGFLGGLGKLVEKLGELAEKGEEFSKVGELKNLDPKGKLRGVYGYSVKFGLGEQGEQAVRVEPFGNIRRDEHGHAVVENAREPLVDVFEEEDHLLVVAEMPGITKADVKLELRDDILTIHAERGEKLYHKEVLLPQPFTADKMQWSCKNGVLEIRLVKYTSPGSN